MLLPVNVYKIDGRVANGVALIKLRDMLRLIWVYTVCLDLSVHSLRVR